MAPQHTDNEALLIAVLKQIQPTGINYKLLASSLGAPSPGAAKARWWRYYQKLKATSPNKPVGIIKHTGSLKKVKGLKFEGSEEGSHGSEEEVQIPREVTPPRRLPARKARAISFKHFMGESEEEYEGGEEEGMDFEQLDNDNNNEAEKGNIKQEIFLGVEADDEA